MILIFNNFTSITLTRRRIESPCSRKTSERSNGRWGRIEPGEQVWCGDPGPPQGFRWGKLLLSRGLQGGTHTAPASHPYCDR